MPPLFRAFRRALARTLSASENMAMYTTVVAIHVEAATPASIRNSRMPTKFVVKNRPRLLTVVQKRPTVMIFLYAPVVSVKMPSGMRTSIWVKP